MVAPKTRLGALDHFADGLRKLGLIPIRALATSGGHRSSEGCISKLKIAEHFHGCSLGISVKDRIDMLHYIGADV